MGLCSESEGLPTNRGRETSECVPYKETGPAKFCSLKATNSKIRCGTIWKMRERQWLFPSSRCIDQVIIVLEDQKLLSLHDSFFFFLFFLLSIVVYNSAMNRCMTMTVSAGIASFRSWSGSTMSVALKERRGQGTFFSSCNLVARAMT